MRRLRIGISCAAGAVVLLTIVVGYGMLTSVPRPRLGLLPSGMSSDVAVDINMPEYMDTDNKDAGADARQQVTRYHGRLFYNRVPKCGSRTIIKFMTRMAAKRSFRLHHSKNFNHTELSVPEQEEFVNFFSRLPKKTVFDRHLYFINFTRYGKPTPLYMNVVRSPLDREVSKYYFLRFIHHGPMSKERRYMTFDECVARKDKECLSPELMIFYFCGQEPACQERTRNTLALAQRNVVQYYQLVGIQEELEAFFRMADYTFPDYFKGMHALYMKARQGEKHVNLNKKREDVNEKTASIMKEVFALDYEFYEFVKHRFYTMYRNIFRNDTQMGS